MAKLRRWLSGGSDEVGWDDLVRRVVRAIAPLGRYAQRGRRAFPPDVAVEIEVDGGDLEIVRGFLEDPQFDAEVGASLANVCDCEPSTLPLREYAVHASDRHRVRAMPGLPRAWSVEVAGGDLSGSTVTLPTGLREIRFGRGEWHGTDQHVRNDIVVCRESQFVSRRAGRLTHAGHHLEVEALDQGDSLLVRRETGEVIRPARTAKGRVVIRAGDAIELAGGAAGESVRLAVSRAIVREDDGRRHR